MAEIETDGLTPKQEQAIVALLSEPTVAKAAAAVSVHIRTIYRWLESPAFARRFRKLRRENFAQAMSLTQRYAPLAINTLARIVADATAPHSSRVAAAGAILKFTRESIELDELASRVEALEIASGLVKPVGVNESIIDVAGQVGSESGEQVASSQNATEGWSGQNPDVHIEDSEMQP